jgi:hypothetical protein
MVQPGDVSEMTKSFSAGKLSSAKGSKGNLCWNAQLICNDASTYDSTNVYKILNYSHEGLGANFFGTAVDLNSNASKRAEIEKKVKDLTTFNNFIDAIVEKKNGFFHIKNTEFK